MPLGWRSLALAVSAAASLGLAAHSGAPPVDPAIAVLQDPAEPFVPFEHRAYRLVNSVAFEPDGSAVYVSLFYREVLAHRGRPDSSAAELGLFRAARGAGGWSEPELLPFSGSYPDYEPALSPDGSMLVFNSKRPYPDGRTPARNDLWMAERTSGGWSAARPLGVNSFDREESYATIDRDRRVVFMRGPTSETVDDYDLYETRLQADGTAGPPRRLPFSDSRFGEGDPQVAPDGAYLIFTRWDNDRGWEASCDLYIAFRRNDGWTEPVPLTEINTPGPDFSPALSSDGQWLYYRAGGRFLRRALMPVLASARNRSG